MLMLKFDNTLLDAAQLKIILDKLDRLEKCKARLIVIRRIRRNNKIKAFLRNLVRPLTK